MSKEKCESCEELTELTIPANEDLGIDEPIPACSLTCAYEIGLSDGTDDARAVLDALAEADGQRRQ